MSRLAREWARLYLPASPLLPTPGEGVCCLVGPPGLTRTLVLGLSRPANWSALAQVWRGVQTDLGWPAPAIAVTGSDGFELWFSLAEAIDTELAARVVNALAQRYLPRPPHLPAERWVDRLQRWPDPVPRAKGDANGDAQRHALPPSCRPRVPRQHMVGQWSAFVAPDLAPVFEDTPWLDIPPSEDGQADVLTALQSVAPLDFQQALASLGVRKEQAAQEQAAAMTPSPEAPQATAGLEAARADATATTGTKAEAQQFLLQVMKDEALPLAHRIDAARALLQHGT